MAREQWIVISKRSNIFNIGDLPRVPTFNHQGHFHDLLKFHSKQEISNSDNLKHLFNANWLKLQKKKGSKIVSRVLDEAMQSVTSSEEDEDKEAAASAVAEIKSVGLSNSVVTDSTVALTSNSSSVILADATSNNITINLPLAEDVDEDFFYIKKIDSSANTVTIAARSADAIDGQSSMVISSQYTSLHVTSDGSNWHVI